jgi:hypothetical protein
VAWDSDTDVTNPLAQPPLRVADQQVLSPSYTMNMM